MDSDKIKLLLIIIISCNFFAVFAQQNKIHQIDSLVNQIRKEHLIEKKIYDSVCYNYPNDPQYEGRFMWLAYYDKTGDLKKVWGGEIDKKWFYYYKGQIIKVQEKFPHRFYIYYYDSKMIKTSVKRDINIPDLPMRVGKRFLESSKKYYYKFIKLRDQ